MLNNVVQNAVALNNSKSNAEVVVNRNRMVAVVVSLIIVLVVNLVVGPFLWNEVARKLVPAFGKARWFDTVALGLLLELIMPTN